MGLAWVLDCVLFNKVNWHTRGVPVETTAAPQGNVNGRRTGAEMCSRGGLASKNGFGESPSEGLAVVSPASEPCGSTSGDPASSDGDPTSSDGDPASSDGDVGFSDSSNEKGPTDVHDWGQWGGEKAVTDGTGEGGESPLDNRGPMVSGNAWAQRDSN